MDPFLEFVPNASFNATNVSAAKEVLLREFRNAHSNGRVRCVNSRAVYAYCQCSKCGCTAAVKQSKLDPSQWIFSACSEMARHPCSGLSVAPHGSASSVSAPSHAPPPAPSHAPPIEPEADCSICTESYLRRDMFECPNPAAHLICQDCFENGVRSQFKEDLIKFVNRDCAIVCVQCACDASIAKRGPTVPFNMQVLSPR
jgi:hypothetical protein